MVTELGYVANQLHLLIKDNGEISKISFPFSDSGLLLCNINSVLKLYTEKIYTEHQCSTKSKEAFLEVEAKEIWVEFDKISKKPVIIVITDIIDAYPGSGGNSNDLAVVTKQCIEIEEGMGLLICKNEKIVQFFLLEEPVG